MTNSGLRGRGGAGFLTGKKWEFASRAAGTLKYVVCNADEGDPGAYMNRAELEGNPHALLEGMAIGTESTKGTKVFCLTGKIQNSGLIEVPMGTTMNEIVFDIGGGIPGGKQFKAAQLGGPSGGFIPKEHLDLPIGYESLQTIGSIMGSGGMVIFDEDSCMVDAAMFFLQFDRDESCGQCLPCRRGLPLMIKTLGDISAGKGEMADFDRLASLAESLQKTSLCALGQTAANPTLSTLRFFHDEYEAHILDKRCPAGVCRPLITVTIDKDKCVGCGACKKTCPEIAISGTIKSIHWIAPKKCVKCGLCKDVCKFDAIVVS